MKRPAWILAALLLAVPLTLFARAMGPAVGPPDPSATDLQGFGAAPGPTVLMPGDRIPNLAWEAEGGRTMRLGELTAAGHALIVFEPTDDQLRALERERPALLQRGITAAAILNRSSRSAWSTARRLGIHCTIIPDPTGVLGEQFGVLGEATRRSEPAWFVVDHGGIIRGVHRSGLPERGFVELASTALHLPAPDASMPSHAR